MRAALNTSALNSVRLNGGTDLPYSLESEMRRMQDTHPLTKILFIDHAGVETDISAYYLSGAVFEQVKERAPDEISAGDFDVTLANNNDLFSEFIVGSLLYGLSYHLASIVVYQGFKLPTGEETYAIQAVGYIDQLIASGDESTVTFRCRDLVRKIIDQKLNTRSVLINPVKNVGMVGNGIIGEVETKPFKTVAETWTITCTTGGGDGVALFSVVGSVSGSIGPATSGAAFASAAAGGVRFTINAGSTVWSVGDLWTFQTKRYPQWTGVNVGKIIWSILTGYNWDTNTQEAWSASVLALDHTQSDANIHLDYSTFLTAITSLASAGNMNLTGYIDYESDAIEVLQNLTLLFLGSLYTGRDGRINLRMFTPGFGGTIAARFSDSRKISVFGYTRTIDEVINYVSVHYKKNDIWPWSGDDKILDGNYVTTHPASIGKYDILAEGFSVDWYAPNGTHVQDFADKLLSRYAEPPLAMDFDTGADALLSEIGDVVAVTDDRYGLFEVSGEVTTISKDFDSQPLTIHMRVRREADLALLFGFLGSRVNEGDGLSPQASTYGAASVTDKQFCYLGALSNFTPDYRMY